MLTLLPFATPSFFIHWYIDISHAAIISPLAFITDIFDIIDAAFHSFHYADIISLFYFDAIFAWLRFDAFFAVTPLLHAIIIATIFSFRHFRFHCHWFAAFDAIIDTLILLSPCHDAAIIFADAFRLFRYYATFLSLRRYFFAISYDYCFRLWYYLLPPLLTPCSMARHDMPPRHAAAAAMIFAFSLPLSLIIFDWGLFHWCFAIIAFFHWFIYYYCHYCRHYRRH